MKKEAKERKVLFEHYSPPWRMVRKHSTAQASFGEKSRQVRVVTSLPEFDQETKMIRRCLALCEVKHCLGDFVALDFTYPPPLLPHEGVFEFVRPSGCRAGHDR